MSADGATESIGVLYVHEFKTEPLHMMPDHLGPELAEDDFAAESRPRLRLDGGAGNRHIEHAHLDGDVFVETKGRGVVDGESLMPAGCGFAVAVRQSRELVGEFLSFVLRHAK